MRAKLYTPEAPPGLRQTGLRLLIVAGLIIGVTFVVYFEGGLKDAQTGKHPGFWDCLYFALVTITTVGYGDIVPVYTSSRLVDALLLTPVRFVVIAIIFGTAYELTLKRFREDYRMARVVGKLDKHVIICGFGATGHSAVQELLLQGTAADQIVVLATVESDLEDAATLGVVGVAGDATQEHALKSVAVERAAHILVCADRDDTGVLVVLTARDLNPDAQVIAMCHQQENAKLLARSGAHVIINPANAGGTLMAAATRRAHLADTMQDILSVGGAIQLLERKVQTSEAGMLPTELAGIAVLRVYRGEAHFDVDALPRLEPGDTLVYIGASGNGATDASRVL
ncbi:MAG: potassium channel family protein [Candidatus Hydrogenedentes bacterium]|nr:potassium channel family protein [Candidatus Hydrogenedentota bacterium]